jgi:hypothetical protein
MLIRDDPINGTCDAMAPASDYSRQKHNFG